MTGVDGQFYLKEGGDAAGASTLSSSSVFSFGDPRANIRKLA